MAALKTSSPWFKPVAWSQNLVLAGVIGLMRLLPYRWRVPFGGWVMRRIIAPVAGYDQRVRDNLALIWPDLPQDRVEDLVHRVCDNAGRTLAELYSPADFKALVADTPILGVGLGPILEAQKDGRGVILVSGHFGNHDIARAVLAGKGMTTGALYRPQRNPYFDEHFAATIRAISEPLFARGRKGLAEMVTHLRTGGMVGMLIDQHFHSGGAVGFSGAPGADRPIRRANGVEIQLLAGTGLGHPAARRPPFRTDRRGAHSAQRRPHHDAGAERQPRRPGQVAPRAVVLVHRRWK